VYRYRAWQGLEKIILLKMYRYMMDCIDTFENVSIHLSICIDTVVHCIDTIFKVSILKPRNVLCIDTLCLVSIHTCHFPVRTIFKSSKYQPKLSLNTSSRFKTISNGCLTLFEILLSKFKQLLRSKAVEIRLYHP